jgi:hypothetical protein
MSGYAELHARLETIQVALADALGHVDRARDLLDESRRAMVDAQAQADPWLPPQLTQATDQLDAHTSRLHGVGELLTGYVATL